MEHFCSECDELIHEQEHAGTYTICRGCGGFCHTKDCWPKHLHVIHLDDCDDKECGICHLCQGPHKTSEHPETGRYSPKSLQ